MCGCGGFGEPPFGIPISDEVHKQYSDELKKAWVAFDNWFKQAQESSDGELIIRETMPKDVADAMQLILDTSIPGYEGSYTGKDSCYMVYVLSRMTD